MNREEVIEDLSNNNFYKGYFDGKTVYSKLNDNTIAFLIELTSLFAKYGIDISVEDETICFQKTKGTEMHTEPINLYDTLKYNSYFDGKLLN